MAGQTLEISLSGFTFWRVPRISYSLSYRWSSRKLLAKLSLNIYELDPIATECPQFQPHRVGLHGVYGLLLGFPALLYRKWYLFGWSMCRGDTNERLSPITRVIYSKSRYRRCFSSMYTEIQPTHKCILCARQDIAFSTKKNLPLHCYRLQLEIGRYIILLQINRSNYYALLYVLWFYFSILHSFLEYSKINSMEFLSIFFLSGRFFVAFFSISFSHFTILT